MEVKTIVIKNINFYEMDDYSDLVLLEENHRY